MAKVTLLCFLCLIPKTTPNETNLLDSLPAVQDNSELNSTNETTSTNRTTAENNNDLNWFDIDRRIEENDTTTEEEGTDSIPSSISIDEEATEEEQPRPQTSAQADEAHTDLGTKETGPNQCRLAHYPKTTKVKDHARCFQDGRYKKRPWLEYCKCKDKASASGYVSVIADESRDNSRRQQLTICISGGCALHWPNVSSNNSRNFCLDSTCSSGIMLAKRQILQILPEGFAAFSFPRYIQPSYTFPSPGWPDRMDPSFIAAFMCPQSSINTGGIGISNLWMRVVNRPYIMVNKRGTNSSNSRGIVHRMSDGSPSFNSSEGKRLRVREGRVEDPNLLDQITKDINEVIVGACGFKADYALVVTWERMAYAGAPRDVPLDMSNESVNIRYDHGGFYQISQEPIICELKEDYRCIALINALNTYQMILATDEVRSYAMFNYAHLNWTSSTADGALFGRDGRLSAKVGFNGGNGTGWHRIPHSPDELVQLRPSSVPGRWVARIDEEIQDGGCFNFSFGTLQVSEKYFDVIGGFYVNVSGPCFMKNDEEIQLQLGFDDEIITCDIINMGIARCYIPINAGRVIGGNMYIALSVDGGKNFGFRNWIYSVPHVQTLEHLRLIDDPVNITNRWSNPDACNLTLDWKEAASNLTDQWSSKRVDIVMWAYSEGGISFKFEQIGYIAQNVDNSGNYSFSPKKVIRNFNQTAGTDFQFGVIQVKNHFGTKESIFSKITPFSWYFKEKWRNELGEDWAAKKCNRWYENDKPDSITRNGDLGENIVEQLESEGLACPCTFDQAVVDIGRFLPLYNCDSRGNGNCPFHRGATVCFISRGIKKGGPMQTCCYDIRGWLMFNQDYGYDFKFAQYYSVAGGAQRSNIWGYIDLPLPPLIAGFSNYQNDVMSYKMCCEYSPNCELYYEKRPTSTCQSYKPVSTAFAFGDPHFVTFDGTRYTFNGNGYFILFSMKTPFHDLMIQVRLEQLPKTIWHSQVPATVITGVAMKDNHSRTVEIFSRKEFTRWRYRMDVYVEGARVFFDTEPQKYQLFRGVSILSPTSNRDMSEIIVIFETGVGVRVRERNGILDVMVVLPQNYNQINTTQFALDKGGLSGGKSCDGFYKTFGLLGTFNNDPSDDLQDAFECTIQESDYPPDENISQAIYENFGQKNRASSNTYPLLFNVNRKPIYNNLVSFSRSRDEWSPILDPKFNDDSYRNLTLSESDVKNTCQDSYACKYDYIVSGNREIALNTLHLEHEALIQNPEIISCGPLPKNRGIQKYPGGNNYLEGITVRFQCDPQYYIYGDIERTCLKNGSWSQGVLACCYERDSDLKECIENNPKKMPRSVSNSETDTNSDSLFKEVTRNLEIFFQSATTILNKLAEIY